MNLSNDNMMLVLIGLIALVVVGVILFIMRNNLAKTDPHPQSQDRIKESGAASIVKTKKL